MISRDIDATQVMKVVSACCRPCTLQQEVHMSAIGLSIVTGWTDIRQLSGRCMKPVTGNIQFNQSFAICS